MEAKVSALMIVTDKDPWNSAGLFTSTDELSRRTNLLQPSIVLVTLPSTIGFTFPQLSPLAITTFPPLTTLPLISTIPSVNYSPTHISSSQPSSLDTFIHVDKKRSTRVFQHVFNHSTLPHFTLASTISPSFPALRRGPLQGLQNEQVHSTIFEPSTSTGTTRKNHTPTLGGKKSIQRPWASKKTKKKLVLGADIKLEDYVSMALCSVVGS
jgi:hypothetical protein